MNVNQALIVLRMNHVPDSGVELREAYKTAATMWHPDRARFNGMDDTTASQNMSRVNQAHMLIKGVMLLRQESRIGRHYSDPLWGQHFVRNEYGYVTSESSLQNTLLLIKGLMRGTKVHKRVAEAQPPTRKTLTDGRTTERQTHRSHAHRKPAPMPRKVSDTGSLWDTGSMPRAI